MRLKDLRDSGAYLRIAEELPALCLLTDLEVLQRID